MGMKHDPKVIFTSLEQEASIPSWAHSLGAKKSTFAKASQKTVAPNVIVIREKSVKSYVSQESFIHEAATNLYKNSPGSWIVAEAGSTAEDAFDLDLITSLMHAFPKKYSNRLDLAFGKDQLRARVLSALAKMERESSLPDPLGEVKQIIDATKDLRNREGRLSAKLVAKAFGISEAELARQLKMTPQAINKNPDSKPLQKLLRPYERIARLRSALSQAQFIAWLDRPVWDLDNKNPLEALSAGHVEAVANYAEDALLGTPS